MALIPPKIPQNINKLEVGSLLFDTTENKLKIFSDNYLINVGENLDFKAFKNYIINGNFLIWQRGTSFNTAGYTADRWSTYIARADIDYVTVSRGVSGPTEFEKFNSPYYLMYSITNHGSGPLKVESLSQAIEDVTKLAGKTVTISFWAKASTENLKLWLEGHQKFGTGGNPSPTTDFYIGEFLLTTEWTKYTYTFTIPSISEKTLGTDGPHTSTFALEFWFSGEPTAYESRIPTVQVQTGTFYIAEVQLEEGTYATSFEHRPYGLELQLCKRYFERLDIDTLIGVAERTSTVVASLQYTQKRVVPTVTIVSYPKVIVADPNSTISAYADSVGYTVSKDGLGLGIYVGSLSFTPQYAYKVRFLVLDIDAEF